MSVSESTPSVMESSTRKHNCSVCGKCFAHACSLKRHSLSHSAKSNVSCTHCTKQFSRLECLRRHCKDVHKLIFYDDRKQSSRSACYSTDNVTPQTAQNLPSTSLLSTTYSGDQQQQQSLSNTFTHNEQYSKATARNRYKQTQSVHKRKQGGKRPNSDKNQSISTEFPSATNSDDDISCLSTPLRHQSSEQVEPEPQVTKPTIPAQPSSTARCSYCNKAYRREGNLRRHLIAIHNDSTLLHPTVTTSSKPSVHPAKQKRRRRTVTSSSKEDNAAGSVPPQHGSGTQSARRKKVKNRKRRKRSEQQNLTTKAAFRDCLEEEFTCGNMTFQCAHCLSYHFLAEKIGDHYDNCCQNGKVDLDESRQLKPVPKLIEGLLTQTSSAAKNFQDNIRKFNSAFAFASLGAKVNEILPGRGPYVFQIHGQVYHTISDSLPAPSSRPSYGQLYVLDSGQALNERLNRPENSECDAETMQNLQQFFMSHNWLARSYKTLREKQEEENSAAGAQSRCARKIKMMFKKDGKRDIRRFNDPTCDEVAVVFDGEDGDPPANVDFSVYPRTSSALHALKPFSSYIDPMTYPVIFPYGELGWSHEISHKRKTASRNSTTQLQYFAYRLAVRDGFSVLHSSGKLLQQYVCDAYVRTEGARLKWIRFNQQALRVQQYQGLYDHVHGSDESNVYNPGRIILPSSFAGSPRNMCQNFQDAMAIVRKYGRPDYFVTVTCNPKWEDITKHIKSHEKPEHRPDVLCRVFHIKLNELLDDIYTKHVLGVPVAGIHVIEFQKRGLPHAHILIILRREDKIREPSQIDEVVSAEIPDRNQHPRLYDIVTKHMIHGPCGVINPSSPCMVNGVCSKGFPKDLRAFTSDNVNGYPEYRRRPMSTAVTVRNHQIDNTWVVPYNKYFSSKYNAHINVEMCSTIKSVKYLFKYVYKGYDSADIEFRLQATDSDPAPQDEIKWFLSGRYVSAPESVWRLSKFKLHDQSHTIYRLAVHLPLQQPVYFRPGEEKAALTNAAKSDTTLTAWFKLNKQDSNARQYFYHEIPNYYVFHEKKWQPRKSGGDKVIGRMYNINPKAGETFFLRLLLLSVTGAHKFEDLRTHNNQLYETFKAAADARGLLKTDDEWRNCLAEASLLQMPRQLRQLFVTICVCCQPSHPRKLYEEFKAQLMEDFTRNASLSAAEQLCLEDIQQNLLLHSMTCESFGLPSPSDYIDQEDVVDAEAEKAAGDTFSAMLTAQQASVVNAVLFAVDNPSGSNVFFLDGPGGTGKTFVYSTLMHIIRGRNLYVIPVSSTGIAATLLKGGRTAHSRFGLPSTLTKDCTSRIEPSSSEAAELRKAILFLWDEAPMASSYALECFDKLMQDVMGNSRPFGGKVVLLGGDFRQVLPVIPRASRAALMACTLKRSNIWAKVKVLKLTQNMRAGENEKRFASWLLQLGNRTLPVNEAITPNSIKLPAECVISGNIVDAIYETSIDTTNLVKLAGSAILCPKNQQCSELNDEVLQRLPGRVTTYYSVDCVGTDCSDEERSNYPPEFLHTLTPSGFPPHELRLKPSAVIMLLRNLNPKKGLCNGTRLIVRRLYLHTIDAEILAGECKGDRVLIPRIEISPTDTGLPIKLSRRQFPIRLSFAMTINKSQGQTFDKIGIFLQDCVFSHGQLYVAFSRVRRPQDVRIRVNNTSHQGQFDEFPGSTFTDNIVFQDAL